MVFNRLFILSISLGQNNLDDHYQSVELFLYDGVWDHQLATIASPFPTESQASEELLSSLRRASRKLLNWETE